MKNPNTPSRPFRRVVVTATALAAVLALTAASCDGETVSTSSDGEQAAATTTTAASAELVAASPVDTGDDTGGTDDADGDDGDDTSGSGGSSGGGGTDTDGDDGSGGSGTDGDGGSGTGGDDGGDDGVTVEPAVTVTLPATTTTMRMTATTTMPVTTTTTTTTTTTVAGGDTPATTTLPANIENIAFEGPYASPWTPNVDRQDEDWKETATPEEIEADRQDNIAWWRWLETGTGYTPTKRRLDRGETVTIRGITLTGVERPWELNSDFGIDFEDTYFGLPLCATEAEGLQPASGCILLSEPWAGNVGDIRGVPDVGGDVALSIIAELDVIDRREMRVNGEPVMFDIVRVLICDVHLDYATDADGEVLWDQPVPLYQGWTNIAYRSPDGLYRDVQNTDFHPANCPDG